MTGEDHRLTSSNGWNCQPRISPSGDRVVYFSSRGGNFDLWLLDIQTGAERPLTNHAAADVAPDWSPDGREVPRQNSSGRTCSAASDCYRFVLTRPEVDVCLSGPANTAQMDEALKAVERGPINDDELAWMRRVGAGGR